MVVVSSSVVHQSKGLCDPPYSFISFISSCYNSRFPQTSSVSSNANPLNQNDNIQQTVHENASNNTPIRDGRCTYFLAETPTDFPKRPVVLVCCPRTFRFQ